MRIVDLNIKIDNWEESQARDRQAYENQKKQHEERMKKGDKLTPLEPFEKKTVFDVSSSWLKRMVRDEINQPDPKTGRPTTRVKLEVHRQYLKLCDAINDHKNGTILLDENLWAFAKRKVSSASFQLDESISSVLIQIQDAVCSAKKEEDENATSRAGE